MKRSPEEIIAELKQTEETIEIKEQEVILLKRKQTKLNIELAETTHISLI